MSSKKGFYFFVILIIIGSFWLLKIKENKEKEKIEKVNKALTENIKARKEAIKTLEECERLENEIKKMIDNEMAKQSLKK